MHYFSTLNSKKNIFLLIVATYCVAIGIFYYPPLLGYWESNIVYHMLAPEKIWINTLIHPRANTGGYEYAILDLTRYVTSVFGENLFSIRLLPNLFGLFSLILFYLVLKNWVNWKASAITTALLSSNPLFLIFQDQLLITIFSFFSLLLCLYSYNTLSNRNSGNIYILLFSIACVFSSLNYIVPRYCMIALVLCWIYKELNIVEVLQSENKLSKLNSNSSNIYRFFLFFFLLIILCNPYNISVIFDTNFLLPISGEVSTSQHSIYESLKVNIPILLGSLLGIGRFFSGENSINTIVSIPYQILNIPLLILFIIGLLYSFRIKKTSVIYLLLVLTFFPIALSEIFSESISSLSSYRYFYFLLPSFILIGIAIQFLFDFFHTNYQKNILLLILIGILVFQSNQYLRDINKFENFLNRFECIDQNTEDKLHYICKNNSEKYNYNFSSKKEYPIEYGLNRYEKYLVPAWKFADELSSKLEIYSEKSNDIFLIKINLQDFPKDLIGHGHTINNNAFKYYIAIYLAEFGVDINYVTPYAGSGPYSIAQDFYSYLHTRVYNLKSLGAKYTSTHLNMPLLYSEYENDYLFDRNNDTHTYRMKNHILKKAAYDGIKGKIYSVKYSIYEKIGLFQKNSNSEMGYHFKLNTTGNRKSNIFLATTESEYQYLDDYLNKSNVIFQSINF